MLMQKMRIVRKQILKVSSTEFSFSRCVFLWKGTEENVIEEGGRL